MIVATRFGFHGKKGLANAVTGSETDAERDPRVRFISFPMAECRDVTARDAPFDSAPYQKELDALLHQFGAETRHAHHRTVPRRRRVVPPAEGVPAAASQRFCRDNDIVFILDEVQANFGRTGDCSRSRPTASNRTSWCSARGWATVSRSRRRSAGPTCSVRSDYGEGSDTWSANPLCCAAVLATLDEFESRDVIGGMKESVRDHRGAGCVALKELPFVAQVRGEQGGMVWGVEMQRPRRPQRRRSGRTRSSSLLTRATARRRHPPARAAREEGGAHLAAARDHARRGDCVNHPAPTLRPEVERFIVTRATCPTPGCTT